MLDGFKTNNNQLLHILLESHSERRYGLLDVAYGPRLHDVLFANYTGQACKSC